MAFTEVEVAVKQLDKKTWELLEPVEYRGKHDLFVVPAGFKTDFASVPGLLTWLVPRYGIYTKSAILHDFLYRKAKVSRAEADGIFRRTLHELNVPFLRRWMMWAAVRIFGSQLANIRPVEILQLSVMLFISIVLLAIPVIVVGMTLVVFWLIEMILFVALGLFEKLTGKRRHVERPKVLGPIKE